MSISKFFLFGLSLSEAFITPYNFVKPPKLSRCNTYSMKKNSSKIYKINFDMDDFENDWFNKPKYPLKMTDYDIALIKFFIYGVINVYLLAYITDIYQSSSK